MAHQPLKTGQECYVVCYNMLQFCNTHYTTLIASQRLSNARVQRHVESWIANKNMMRHPVLPSRVGSSPLSGSWCIRTLLPECGDIGHWRKPGSQQNLLRNTKNDHHYYKTHKLSMPALHRSRDHAQRGHPTGQKLNLLPGKNHDENRSWKRRKCVDDCCDIVCLQYLSNTRLERLTCWQYFKSKCSSWEKHFLSSACLATSYNIVHYRQILWTFICFLQTWWRQNSHWISNSDSFPPALRVLQADASRCSLMALVAKIDKLTLVDHLTSVFISGESACCFILHLQARYNSLRRLCKPGVNNSRSFKA